MELEINGETRQFDSDPQTVAGLLELLELAADRGMAVAVNDEVIPRGRWQQQSVDDGDRVEIIRATQGG